MFVNRLHIIFTLALATAAGVSAQSIPQCVLIYSTDFKCLCASTAFQATAGACINSTCSSSDQAAALQLEQAECGSRTYLLETLLMTFTLTHFLSQNLLPARRPQAHPPLPLLPSPLMPLRPLSNCHSSQSSSPSWESPSGVLSFCNWPPPNAVRSL